MSWCSDAPGDEAISLFAGLLANPDVPLSPRTSPPETSFTTMTHGNWQTETRSWNKGSKPQVCPRKRAVRTKLYPRDARSGLWNMEPRQPDINRHIWNNTRKILDYFCPKCWSFEDFRHNKDAVRDWSFMRASIEKGNKIGERPNPTGLRGPLTDSEMQKVADFYLKIGKAPGPDNIQVEFIKTMSPEHLRVIQL